MNLTQGEIGALEVIEHQRFTPLGWLYRSVYENLRSRGLAKSDGFSGFVITDYGRSRLGAARHNVGNEDTTPDEEGKER